MSNWLLIIVVLAAAGILYTLYQRNQSNGKTETRRELPLATDRNYQKEREEARVAHLSEDDRAWEAASLERNLANQKLRDATSEQNP